MYTRYSAMAANKLKVAMFLGSVRENRLVDRVGKFLKKELEESSHEVAVFDPLEMKFPLLERALHHYKDRSQVPQWMQDAEQKLREADAVVVVTAEYNHSIPPALSNMMDHFGSSCYSYKPSAIVCYSPGLYGGMRAAMQLRAFLGELGCLSVSNIFGIPEVHKSLAEDGTPLNDHMKSGFSRLVKQMDWHAWAMKNHRDKVGLPQ